IKSKGSVLAYAVISCLISLGELPLAVADNGCIVNGVANNPRNCTLPFFLVHGCNDTVSPCTSEIMLASNGSLTVFARCALDATPGNRDAASVFVTSSVDGWFAEGQQNLSAGDQVVLNIIDTPNDVPVYDSVVSSVSAIAPTGHYIATSHSVTLGVNVFGNQCLVAGTITAITSQ
ncbi:MAG: hypothetical protein R3330_17940, partial [Saprospiraceae bacterium]|nr:hypothetical protein [Saprospiraceae bacterium]